VIFFFPSKGCSVAFGYSYFHSLSANLFPSFFFLSVPSARVLLNSFFLWFLSSPPLRGCTTPLSYVHPPSSSGCGLLDNSLSSLRLFPPYLFFSLQPLFNDSRAFKEYSVPSLSDRVKAMRKSIRPFFKFPPPLFGTVSSLKFEAMLSFPFDETFHPPTGSSDE